MSIHMEKKNFKELINAETPVLVDFFATWCGPCQTLTPIVEEVANELGDKVKVIKVDIDKNQKAALAYNIRGVPTLILFKSGNMVWRKSGLLTKRELKAQISDHI